MVKIFPVHKGDLCKITEQCNQLNIHLHNRYRFDSEDKNHPRYGHNLIVVSDLYFTPYDPWLVVDVFDQQTSSYDYAIWIGNLERI